MVSTAISRTAVRETRVSRSAARLIALVFPVYVSIDILVQYNRRQNIYNRHSKACSSCFRDHYICGGNMQIQYLYNNRMLFSISQAPLMARQTSASVTIDAPLKSLPPHIMALPRVPRGLRDGLILSNRR